jgi:hypothetical protein
MISIPAPQFRKRRKLPKRTPPPPPVVTIQSVLAGDFAADWQFDSDVITVLNVSPLKINGTSATGVEEVSENVIRAVYDIPINPGDPWTYDGSPIATFANGGAVQPGSGVTEEG